MSNKVDRTTFHQRLEQFVNQMRTEIISGVRQPASYLPAESTLAKQFQLSNKSIRRGLDVLVDEGLIVKIDRVGSMVTDHVDQIITVNFIYNSSLNSDFLLDEILVEFQRMNPNIYVRTIPVAIENYVGTFQEMFNNGMIDVVSFNSVQFQEIKEKGLTSLLDPITEVDGLYPITLEAFEFDGQYWNMPISFSPVVLCYNKKHFAEARLDEPDSYWSWNDLLETATKLSEIRNKHAIYFVPTSENRYPLFLMQGGMQKDSVKSEQLFSEETMIKSLQIYSSLVKNQTIFPRYFADRSDDDTLQLFEEEQVSMIITTYFNLNALNNNPAISYDISPVPSVQRDDPQKTLLLTIGAAVSRNSRVKDAAHKLVNFLASEQAQQIIKDKTVSLPVRRAVAEANCSSVNGSSINRPSRSSAYRELFPSYKYHAELGLSVPLMKSFSRSFKAYWSEMIDDEMLQQQLQQMIKQHHHNQRNI